MESAGSFNALAAMVRDGNWQDAFTIGHEDSDLTFAIWSAIGGGFDPDAKEDKKRDAMNVVRQVVADWCANMTTPDDLRDIADWWDQVCTATCDGDDSANPKLLTELHERTFYMGLRRELPLLTRTYLHALVYEFMRLDFSNDDEWGIPSVNELRLASAGAK